MEINNFIKKMGITFFIVSIIFIILGSIIMGLNIIGALEFICIN